MKRFFQAIRLFFFSLCISTAALGTCFYLAFETRPVQNIVQRLSRIYFPALVYESVQWKLPFTFTLHCIYLKHSLELSAERAIYEGHLGLSPSSLTLEKPHWTLIHRSGTKKNHFLALSQTRSFPRRWPVSKIYINQGDFYIQREEEDHRFFSLQAIKGTIESSSSYPLLEIQAECTYVSPRLPGDIQAQVILSSVLSSGDSLCSYSGTFKNIRLGGMQIEQMPSVQCSYEIKRKGTEHTLQVHLQNREFATCHWTHLQNKDHLHTIPLKLFITEMDVQFDGALCIQNEQWQKNSALQVKIGSNSPFFHLMGEDGGKIFISGNLLSPRIVFSDSSQQQAQAEERSLSFYPTALKTNSKSWSYTHVFDTAEKSHQLHVQWSYLFHKESRTYRLELHLLGEIPLSTQTHFFLWIDSQTSLEGIWNRKLDWSEIRSSTQLYSNLHSFPRVAFTFLGQKDPFQEVQNGESLPLFRATLHSKDMVTERYSFKQFWVSLSNQTGKIVLDLSSIGRLNHFPFHINGTCFLNSIHPYLLKASFSSLEGFLDDISLALDKPFCLSVSPGYLQIEEAVFRLNDGQLILKLQKDEVELSTQITLKHFPERLLLPLLEKTKESFLEGKASLLIRKDKQELYLHLKEKKVDPLIFKGAPCETDIILSLLGNYIDTTIVLNQQYYRPFFLKGTLPIRLRPIFPYFFLEKTCPFSCKASLPLPLSLVQGLFLKDQPWRVQGNCFLRCEAHGPLHDTKITGKMDLEDGAFLYPEKGIYLACLAGTFHCEGKQISWRLLEGNTFWDGKICSKGVFSWNKEGLYLKATAEATNACLFRTDLFTLQGTGHLVLSLSSTEQILSGDLTLTKSSFHLPEHSQALNPLLCPPEETYSTNHWLDIHLNIALRSEGDLSVEGDGIRSRWKGLLQAEGSICSPQLRGTCQSIYGTIRIGEHYFDLKQGTMAFEGPLDSAYIRLSAELPIHRYLIVATYQGLLKDPQFFLTSKPSGLSSRKIISLILFGNMETGGIDLLELFSQTRKRNDSVHDLVRSIKKSFQVDHIGITTSPNEREGHYFLQVGKHLAKNMLVTLRKRLNSSEATAGIYTQISPSFSIRAEAGVPWEGCLHFLWRVNY
ncbi:translocation/assembly module TamB domain-containing protein [Candidatus Similichlamydia laticola]|uniref:Translocation and assembly module TamB C-terminal domain-containing protein n=1 Tax=Candidatus Similichlamydia laticola TaxID=2170265 RepID=A0A369KDV7_9BACT|nr:translocation/assembly module TamB domain-containing protein [Candidatus Similichlamydia laticola]RDB31640.1 hypothetical protein HAT2_00251 [Candidatus Similichlamydia laticola]